MNEQSREFWETFSKRLSGARKMAGMSLRQLSEQIEKRVSYQTLSNWEKGRGEELPSMEIIAAMAAVMGLRYDYFFAPVRRAMPQPEFRKRKSRLKKKEEAALLERAQFLLDRYLELEELTGMEVKVENPIGDIGVTSVSDAERAARALRKHWNLGSNPIPQVVEMLEEKGIRVVKAEAPDSFDGLAAWAGEIPFLLINEKSAHVCRLRFTLLHELGHLFLNIPDALDEKAVEGLCNRFASALLFPEGEFKKHFGENRKHWSLEELVYLKEEWGMSIGAITYRARDLGLISDGAYKRFSISYQKKGFRQNEPGDYKMQETPRRFRQLLLRAYAEELISGTKAAYFSNETYEAFHKNCILVA